MDLLRQTTCPSTVDQFKQLVAGCISIHGRSCETFLDHSGLHMAGAAAYAAFMRPRHLRWGSTKREQRRTWPGDEFMPVPVTQATRAITIDAPAERVWPWVAQIGQDRGGFYSYTQLENLIGCGMKNADEIYTEWQSREIGEKVWLGAASNFDGKAYMVVARRVPGRVMVLVAPPDWDRIRAGSAAIQIVWSFIVEPIDAGSSRLIARTLGGPGVSFGQKLANYLVWEPAHFIMERGMLLGIRQRAEAANWGVQPAGHRHPVELTKAWGHV